MYVFKNIPQQVWSLSQLSCDTSGGERGACGVRASCWVLHLSTGQIACRKQRGLFTRSFKYTNSCFLTFISRLVSLLVACSPVSLNSFSLESLSLNSLSPSLPLLIYLSAFSFCRIIGCCVLRVLTFVLVI